MRRLLPALVLPLLASCGAEHSEAGGGEDGFADGRTLVQALEIPGYLVRPRVDLILVVDDSPSFGAFTPTWATNLEAFAAVIEADDVRADIRVAITTTSVPGPTCAGPRARGGEAIVESCRAHLEDLVGPDEHGELGGGVQDHQAVCEQACSVAEIPRRLSPGRDEHDLASLAIRPWIEARHNPHLGNLDGIALAEALTCAGLQGHAGCAFESPIEAAARMVERLAEPGDPMSEFRRPEAGLMILFVGDEDDCSHPDSSATIFDPAGARTFWPDPDASAASSGICIRAGLSCDADGCTLTDHDLAGEPTDDPASAVLTPTERLHAALVAAGEYDDPDSVPYVAAVAGYRSDGSLRYTSPAPGVPADQQPFFDAFAVLPGCVGSSPANVPPLLAAPGGRLAEVVSDDAQFSICDPDWAPALEVIAARGGPGFRPWCIELDGVADLAPDEPLPAPDCVVEEIDYLGERATLPLCERDGDAWRVDPDTSSYVIPPGADACWIYATDPGGVSESLFDDMDVECSEAGHLGQIRLTRRPDSYLAYDSRYELRCRAAI